MFNFILTTEETTEDSFKVIGYAWLPMVVWPLLIAQTIYKAPTNILIHAPAKITPDYSAF